MSYREQIAEDIVKVLKNVKDLQPSLVTREPFDVEKIAITQFPAILVNTGTETRETVTLGSGGLRRGTIEYQLRCFVRGNLIDKKRNEMIEVVEEELDRDRNRLISGQVIDTQITSIEVIDRLPPLGEVIVTVAVSYQFTRGTS